MFKSTFVIFLLFYLLTANAENAANRTYGNVIIAEVTSIYDGDTFRATINGWPAIIGERIPIRINGIDAPEMKGKCQKEIQLARQAKQFSVERLRSAKKIELRNLRREKYFRLLADVYVDGDNLGAMLMNKGLARTYGGGLKMSWCH